MASEFSLSGYEDATEIGKGAFGVVYRARQVEFGRDVAIKVITGLVDEESLRRFDRERLGIGSLSGYANIVTVYASGRTDDGRPYMVMEYLARGSLADRLQSDGPLEWREAGDLGVKVAGALSVAHAAGVLHRDVKPENILVSAYGEPKLGDFGIARIDAATRTRTGVVTATVAHAAPEIIEGRASSRASDVYSLASTIHTLIAGSTPFVRDTDESLIPVFSRIATEPPPDLRPRGVPDALCAVLEEGMAKDPAARIGTAAEFGERLRAAINSPAPAPPTTPEPKSRRAKPEPKATKEIEPPAREAEPELAKKAEPNRTGAEPTAMTPRGRSRRRLVVGAAVAAVLAAGGVGAVALSRGGGGGGDKGGRDVADDVATIAEEDYTAEINEICVAANEDLGVVFEEVFADLGEDGEPTPEQQQAAADGALPIFRQMLDEIEDLDGPSSLERKVDELVDGYRGVADEIEDDPAVIFTTDAEDPFVNLDEQAIERGLDDCVQSG